MKTRSIPYALVLAAAAALAGCTHTPPGTSVEVALAKRPEVVRYPQPAVVPVARQSPTVTGPSTVAVDRVELVADAFSRGEFCMQTGKDQEAISAFREVVKIDPKFAEAWNHLASLYEKSGNEQAALEAFRKSKTQ